MARIHLTYFSVWTCSIINKGHGHLPVGLLVHWNFSISWEGNQGEYMLHFIKCLISTRCSLHQWACSYTHESRVWLCMRMVSNRTKSVQIHSAGNLRVLKMLIKLHVKVTEVFFLVRKNTTQSCIYIPRHILTWNPSTGLHWSTSSVLLQMEMVVSVTFLYQPFSALSLFSTVLTEKWTVASCCIAQNPCVSQLR